MAECHRLAVLAAHDARGPDLLVDADISTVEVVRIVVRGQSVFLALERELTLGDAVGHTAGGHTEVGMSIEVILKFVMPEHHVAEFAVFIRHMHLGEHCAVGDDLRLQPVFVGQDVGIHLFAVFGFSKCFFFHGTLLFLFRGQGRLLDCRAGKEHPRRKKCHCFLHNFCQLSRRLAWCEVAHVSIGQPARCQRHSKPSAWPSADILIKNSLSLDRERAGVRVDLSFSRDRNSPTSFSPPPHPAYGHLLPRGGEGIQIMHLAKR